MNTALPSTTSALALHGGRPVRTSLLPYGHHAVTEDDIRAVVDALRSDRLTTGPKVAEFEEAVAASVGSRFAVAFSSGTAALHAAAFAAGLGPGDEAITTPLTFCATANCVLYQGARPVFADVCPDTLNLDPRQAAPRIGPRTKAVLPMDYAGHPADLEAFLELADQHGLVVIEDACHALGATFKSRRVGGISHMTVFSFHPVKHITTGEGGMVTTDSAAFAKQLRMFRNHGIESDPNVRAASGRWDYAMEALGFNYRLSDIGCALGRSQLARLPAVLARRHAIASAYTRRLEGLPGILLPSVRPDVTSAWHLYPLRLDPERCRTGRDEVFRALQAEGLGVNVHYLPVHRHPYYRRRFGDQDGRFPVAESAFDRLISLPLFHGMSEQDVDDVVQAVTKVAVAYGG